MKKIIILIFVLMFSVLSFSVENVTYSFYVSHIETSSADADFYIQTKDGKKFGYDFEKNDRIQSKDKACFYIEEGHDLIISDDGTEDVDDNSVQSLQSCKFLDDSLSIFLKATNAGNYSLLTSVINNITKIGNSNNSTIPALPNIISQYEIKFDKSDVKKIDVAKVVDENTIQKDIDACTDMKFFVKICPPQANKFNFPDECVIGSQANTPKTPATPVKTGGAAMCTMDNVCYARAMKDVASDLKTSADLSRKKITTQKLIKLLTLALEKNELKSPCDKLLKVDLDVLIKKF